ncbi:mrna export [Moniliophthora roreri MCA 2997]|uniref:Mrna export n=2 Tax=Moniliophthora roreri TaxID=221103 RepID=V2XE16_MONRO|nr:mrna export [Moniliophthora roreri MCA 2997]KAI3612499.1 mrna export [Moniliophthora roreri]
MSLSRLFIRSLCSPRLTHRFQSHQRASRCIPTRAFSITSRREASEPDLGELYVKLSKTTIFKKLAESPSAINAVKEFGEAMQKQGLDTTKPPTTMQMLKLSMNKDFREAALRLQEEFQRAGIDLTDKAVMDELMQAMKKD